MRRIRIVALARPIPHNLVGGVELPPPLKPAEVEQLHGELKTTLRALVGGGPPGRAFLVPIPTEGLTEELIRLTPVGARPAKFATSYGHTNARTAVFQKVKDLVLQAGADLLGCPAPACGMAFMRRRKQIFCTTECAQRVRNQRNAPKRRKGGRGG